MKAFFVILLAVMTAWVAVTADEMNSAHKAAGRPMRVSASASPAEKQLRELVNEYGARQVLLGGVGIAAGLFLAFSVAMKLLKLLAMICVIILAFVLWQAWERGYLTEAQASPPSPMQSSRLA
jgi:hypothetical protein